MHKPLVTLVAMTLLGQSAVAQDTAATADHPYVGMWVTQDGNIRHELLPNHRYIEARGSRERAYEGRYEVTGTHIEYWDDTGFTADGDFIDGVLHHAGMILYRR
ncbi:Atu4866 domain-containing protein [Mesorhizobium sp. LHD-90]|nr:Atu4866 domain-containing protein [Mesorhizobium sp. LHD-90]MDQ6436472.1 Atu4866 domain-containing protein [Mesorhizobium sp. LHD-90]